MFKYVVILILVSFSSFCQKAGVVAVLNQDIVADFRLYSPSLKLHRVETKSQIDYSKIEGLVLSYYSALDLNWSQSDYLDTLRKSVKDAEHFEAIRKLDKEKNYIEIDHIYSFEYENASMAYVKYSIIFEALSFPLISCLSVIYKDNRWYIYELPNQSDITAIIAGFDSERLKELFEGKSTSNKIIDEIIGKTRNVHNGLDFQKLSDQYNLWLEDTKKYSLQLTYFRDKRWK